MHTLRDGAWKRFDMLRALRAAYPDFTGTQKAGGTIIFTVEGALADPVSGQAPIRPPRPGSLTLADLTG